MPKTIRIALCWCLALAFMAVMPASAQEAEQAEEDDANGDAEEQQEEVREPRVTIISHGPGRLEERLEARFPDQSVTLEADGQPFTALRKERTIAARQGGALIIADVGRSPAVGWPAGIRRRLADAGWMSLSIGLPQAAVEGVPGRVFEPRQPLPDEVEEVPEDEQPAEQQAAEEAAPDNAEDANGADAGADGEEAPDREQAMTINVPGELDQELGDEWQDQALARVAAAVNAMREEGLQNIVLIGIGTGADIGLRYMVDNQAMFPPGGLGMVWIAPRLRPPHDEALDESLGEGLAIPVLDLYDRRVQREAAANRLEASRRGNFENYAQGAMPLHRHTNQAAERRVGARVSGWLRSNMVGMELD